MFIGTWAEAITRFEYSFRLLGQRVILGNPGLNGLTTAHVTTQADVLGLYHACTSRLRGNLPIVDVTTGKVAYSTASGASQLRVEPAPQGQAKLTLTRAKPFELSARTLILSALTHHGHGNAGIETIWDDPKINSAKRWLAFAGLTYLLEGFTIDPDFWRRQLADPGPRPEPTRPIS